jgi:hypothetical protein
MTFDDSRLRRNVAIFFVAVLFVVVQLAPATAAMPGHGALHKLQVNDTSAIVPVVVVHKGRAVVGPRGGAVVRRSTVVRPGVRPVRPAVRPGRWVRPGWYRWPPGGAIAAGAAIGFVTAATAAAWAGSPPAPGYCWYYTDPSQRQGFWDVCQ